MMLDELDTLAQQTAQALLADGLTLRQAGELLGVSHQTVANMAHGRGSPRPWVSRTQRGRS
jgi:transcriptional regulator with XRE-family HTH domain